MTDSKPPLDPKLSFAAGWLLGRRGRNRSGAGCLFLLIGIFAAMVAMASLIGAPLSWLDAREAKRLAQPAPAELVTMAPGTRLLTVVQLPPGAPTGDHGLALYYTEVLQTSPTAAASMEGDAVGTTGGPSGWQRETVAGWQAEVRAADGAPLTVQLPPDAALHNASTVVDAQDRHRRYVGYLPGQAVTLRGSWEGSNLLTAEALYAGSVDDYVRYLSRRPGFVFLGGLVCGGIALVFLMMGGVLRFLGN